MKKIISLIFVICLCFSLTVSASAGEPEIYGTGSVAKVFCAAAIMKLVDEGLINLDEPVVTYLPDFSMADERYQQITVRMLISNSAGFYGSTLNGTMLLGDNNNKFYLNDFLNSLKSKRLKHNPGDRGIYSNDGFTMAEILIERVSGMSYTEFLENNFFKPLGVSIYTRNSEFDREKLASIYMGNNELKHEEYGMSGTGGLYAAMENTLKYATIFFDKADGSILSRTAVDEMAKNQHRNIMFPNADFLTPWGLGWDTVETYPYSQLGIKALSKGGDTGRFKTNLTVLPEHNLAVTVSSSGNADLAQLIAQEIIIEVLKEEGLIPTDYEITTANDRNMNTALVPESIKANAGFYDTVGSGIFTAEFTDTSLILTPFSVKNERPMEFIYNTDGEFVSTNNECLGLNGIGRGFSALRFENGCLITRTFEEMLGLSAQEVSFVVAGKILTNPLDADILRNWSNVKGKEYLLVNERFSSNFYIGQSLAKIQIDERLPGYVGPGILKGKNGKRLSWAKITDERIAIGYQNMPTVFGNINNLWLEEKDGIEYLGINDFLYIDAAVCQNFSDIGASVVIDREAVWFDIGEQASGRIISIEAPENGSWHIFNDKMDCVATSLEKNVRNQVILPENGRICFAGEAGAAFKIEYVGF